MARCKHNIDERWCGLCSPHPSVVKVASTKTVVKQPPMEEYPAKLPAELHALYDAVLVAERDGRMTRFMVRHERLWWTLCETFQLLRPAKGRCYRFPEELARQQSCSPAEVHEQFQAALTQLGIVTS